MPTCIVRGKVFQIREDLHNPAAVESFVDEWAVRERWWHVQPGDVVFDIGAGFGSYTVPALAHEARHVYAWSPEADGDGLIQNLEANGWQDRCTVMRYGLHRDFGWWHPAGHVFTQQPPTGPGWIFVGPLDRWVEGEQIGQCNWIKIDTEGAEVDVLTGGLGTIQTFRPKILIENHLFIRPELEQEAIELIAKLDLGYRAEVQPYHRISHTFFTPA